MYFALRSPALKHYAWPITKISKMVNRFYLFIYLNSRQNHIIALNGFSFFILMLRILWSMKLYLIQSVLFPEEVYFYDKQKYRKKLVIHLYADQLRQRHSISNWWLWESKNNWSWTFWTMGECTSVNIENYFSSTPIARFKLIN